MENLESSIPPGRDSRAYGSIPLAEIRCRKLPDNKLWVRRSVEGPSLEDIQTTVGLLSTQEAVRRYGEYTLSVLYPREIRLAAKEEAQQAAEKSLPGRRLNPLQIASELKRIMPESLQQPKEARVDKLDQFYNKIAFCVSYPEFDEERSVLTSGLNEILGIEYEWPKGKPHISIARGQLENVGNRAEIEASLPEIIRLSPV